MTDDLKIVMVPRDLYYHEIAYVRGLQAEIERLREALKEIEWSNDTKWQADRARATLKDTKP